MAMPFTITPAVNQDIIFNIKGKLEAVSYGQYGFCPLFIYPKAGMRYSAVMRLKSPG